jgi:chromosomal replication initiator protein
VSCVTGQDPQLLRLAEAIAAKVGQQRFHVWFNNSTRMDLKTDALEICVPNDFISEWIGSHFSKPIQEAAQEVLGSTLRVKFNVVPQLFDPTSQQRQDDLIPAVPAHARPNAMPTAQGATVVRIHEPKIEVRPPAGALASNYSSRGRLRHDLDTFVIGASNQLAYNAGCHVADFPGSQYTPLFIHGSCGLGKTHLLQGICRRFIEKHPMKRWAYMTGEEFTNEFVNAMRTNKLDAFRRRMRELDLLVIDDVHFLSGKKATQEEFLHTFNAIEAMGRQVVMASDSHPKMIEEFGESLINRFVSGMVVRVDPPNFQMRSEILKRLAAKHQVQIPEQVAAWIARRVTQNVRELEGAVTRIAAYARLNVHPVDDAMAQEALGDLERQHVQPIRVETIVQIVCDYFGVSHKDMLSNRREHAISLPRSVAMYLVRRMARLSYPEIGHLLNKKNHSTVISACRRIESALAKNEMIEWSSSVGERREDAAELLQRLEEHCRAAK